MIVLQTDTAAQQFTVTLRDMWSCFDTNPESYLMILEDVHNGPVFAVLPVILTDVFDQTLLRISTATNDAVNGAIEILLASEYKYVIYGQTGTTNLDPLNAAVIGVFEKGTCIIEDTTTLTYTDETTIPTTYVDRSIEETES